MSPDDDDSRGRNRPPPRPSPVARTMKPPTRIAGRMSGPPSGLRGPAGEGSERADDAQRRIAFRFGLSAESRAAALLIAKGYRILARRFRTPLGEIDIVARRRGVLVFLEVKARDSFDTAAEAIGKRQQDRIIAAAQLWLAGHPEDAMRAIRFDVVLVVPGCVPRHLPAAFDAST
jgi:putative endonuclease